MAAVNRFFVLDDESTVLSVIKHFLDRFAEDGDLSIDVNATGDAIDGLFELTKRGEEYRAILLDVRTPFVSGDEIYRSLLHVNPSILNRILFITGFPDDLTDRFPDRELNILPKPFRYSNFAEKLSALLAA